MANVLAYIALLPHYFFRVPSRPDLLSSGILSTSYRSNSLISRSQQSVLGSGLLETP